MLLTMYVRLLASVALPVSPRSDQRSWPSSTTRLSRSKYTIYIYPDVLCLLAPRSFIPSGSAYGQAHLTASVSDRICILCHACSLNHTTGCPCSHALYCKPSYSLGTILGVPFGVCILLDRKTSRHYQIICRLVHSRLKCKYACDRGVVFRAVQPMWALRKPRGLFILGHIFC